jgi:hypothetical protein
MLKQEFVALCQLHNPNAFKNGLEDNEYCQYEALYNEISDIDKQAYCELLMTDVPQLLDLAASTISYHRKHAEQYAADREALADALALRGGYDTIREVYDMKTVINMKLDIGDPLTDEEREYVKNNLK